MTAHTTVPTAPPIHGRGAERHQLAALPDRLRTGSAVLVLTGEPGLGRTTLLDEAARAFRPGPVLYVRCDAADPQPYGGVRALTAAAGHTPAGALDPRTAPRVLLDAFRAAAGDGPLLVCLDDVHLWDTPSRTALAHAARRLPGAGRVGLLLTTLGPGPADRDVAGLPALQLHPLPSSAAGALLDEVTGSAVDPALRDDLLEEADGNPALLLAMVRRLTPAQLSGDQDPPRPLADPRTLTGVTGEWPAAPNPAVEDLLLLTATALRGTERTETDAAVIRAAARECRPSDCAAPPGAQAMPAVPVQPGGLACAEPSAPPAAPAPREAASLLDDSGLPDTLLLSDGRLRFASSLARRVVYARAAPDRRRAAHRALAQALRAQGRELPALVHEAWATTGPAPERADRLAAAAAGGPNHRLRATALARAADLTPPGLTRRERYTAAAEQELLAGRPRQALRLLAEADHDLDTGGLLPGDVDSLSGCVEAPSGRADLLSVRVDLAGGRADLPSRGGDLPSGPVDLLSGRVEQEGAAPGLVRSRAAQATGHAAQAVDLARQEPAPAGQASHYGVQVPGGTHQVPARAGQTPGRHALAPTRTGRAAGPAAQAPGRTVQTPVAAVPAPGTAGHGPGHAAAQAPSHAAAQAPSHSDQVPDQTTQTPDPTPQAPHPTTPAPHHTHHPQPAHAPVDLIRGRAEMVRGLAQLLDGPVADARASLLSAAALLGPVAPAQAASAALAAADAAWAGGDLPALREALCGAGGDDDYRVGLAALLDGRLDLATVPLRRVVGRARTAAEPEDLLRAAAAALVLGDMPAAAEAGARALAAARIRGSATLVPRALEYLAYAELRAGRHAQARTHAEEGLRTARRTGQRNTAAHHHAVLALAASIEGEGATVDGHAGAALATARAHGLAQPATLAQWAAARADLGRGRPLEAADRLGPLVCPGPRRGHFAVWMLAVPCFVEAAVRAGRADDARQVVADFAAWAGFGADPQAPAQLLRCHALLAPPDRAGDLYVRALALHEQAGGDFERARTELLYGKWLRRRRRPREARDRLGAALVGFDRCGAHVWAEQTRAELRANGAAATVTAPRGTVAGPDALARLTPQQWRIARCVAQGATNREVARSLSVSTRTVDYHLRNVFAALGVRSRVELARLVERAEKTRAQL
ncbi:LuxR family transcriptional regulator [Streptomyces sp. JB150]|uniref:helix-turn-helix transcriptional regulator n=1 Tax=Streptomyces sp. JB150 TaxID=2714844 RepID=UPI00140ACD98|nr:LuxR family transcriptional regulator [Streptomyces sp. JB150]QIJ66213.1 AAA family ATPase [Streptomyces sp. JB150]